MQIFSNKRAIFFLAILISVLGLHCKSSPNEPNLGDELATIGGKGQACYPNKTCNEALSCIDDVCAQNQACGELIPAACAREAIRLGFGPDREHPERVRAKEMLAAACDADTALACRILATAYQPPTDLPSQPQLFTDNIFEENAPYALELHERACELGSAPSCLTAASTYFQGEKGIAADKLRAVDLFNRSCDLGSTAGCLNVALKIKEVNDENERIHTNSRAALLNMLQAIDDREQQKFSTNLSFQFTQTAPNSADQSPPLPTQDEFLPLEMLLGTTYLNGEGIPKNTERASEYFDQACKKGYANGCLLFASLKWNAAKTPRSPNDRDIILAMSASEDACKANIPLGCFIQSKFSVALPGDLGQTNVEATAQLQKICLENRLEAACELHAAMYK